MTKQNTETPKVQPEQNIIPDIPDKFKDKSGDTIRKTEGLIQPKILENYMREQLNG